MRRGRRGGERPNVIRIFDDDAGTCLTMRSVGRARGREKRLKAWRGTQGTLIPNHARLPPIHPMPPRRHTRNRRLCSLLLPSRNSKRRTDMQTAARRPSTLPRPTRTHTGTGTRSTRHRTPNLIRTPSKHLRLLMSRSIPIKINTQPHSSHYTYNQQHRNDTNPSIHPPMPILGFLQPRRILCASWFCEFFLCDHGEPTPEIVPFFASARKEWVFGV